MLDTECWVLPRPRSHKMYVGGFPRFFEHKLLKLYDYPEKILHPFGGFAEYGTALDIKMEANPDVLGDAHFLPFERETFDFIIFDPPYSEQEAAKYWQTKYVSLGKCLKESIRVLKYRGFIAIYHRLWVPCPDYVRYHKRIVVLPGQWHEARICHIFQRDKRGL